MRHTCGAVGALKCTTLILSRQMGTYGEHRARSDMLNSLARGRLPEAFLAFSLVHAVIISCPRRTPPTQRCIVEGVSSLFSSLRCIFRLRFFSQSPHARGILLILSSLLIEMEPIQVEHGEEDFLVNVGREEEGVGIEASGHNEPLAADAAGPPPPGGEPVRLRPLLIIRR